MAKEYHDHLLHRAGSLHLRRNRRRTVALWAAVLSIIGLTGHAYADDFGDAPDGGPTGYAGIFEQTGAFPTLAANNGARAADLTRAVLGAEASDEQDANDPNDPDGQPNLNPANTDADDGIVNFILRLVSIPPPADMVIRASAPAGSAGGRFWANVVIDLNLDGQWGGMSGPGVPEWVVKNFPVVVPPGAGQQDVRLPSFFFGFGNRLPDGAWMRIALTDSPILTPDWDGTGQFAAGEVEDHIIELPDIAENGGKDIRIVTSCMPNMFEGAGPHNTTCTLTNLGSDAGLVTFMAKQDLGLAKVGVVAPIPAPAACVPPLPPGDGPIACAPIAIPAGGPPLGLAPPATATVRLTANKPMPGRSVWTYRSVATDPPAVITEQGVIAGHGDSTGELVFFDPAIMQPPPKRPYKRPPYRRYKPMFPKGYKLVPHDSVPKELLLPYRAPK